EVILPGLPCKCYLYNEKLTRSWLDVREQHFP
ncbi:hypothetical protein Csa_023519, partial [Cucumis sativus]